LDNDCSFLAFSEETFVFQSLHSPTLSLFQRHWTGVITHKTYLNHANHVKSRKQFFVHLSSSFLVLRGVGGKRQIKGRMSRDGMGCDGNWISELWTQINIQFLNHSSNAAKHGARSETRVGQHRSQSNRQAARCGQRI